jgi:hypothetical protein
VDHSTQGEGGSCRSSPLFALTRGWSSLNGADGIGLLAQSGDPVAVEALLIAVEAALSRYVGRLVGPLAAPDVLQDSP